MLRLEIPLALIGIVGSGCGLDGEIDSGEMGGWLGSPLLDGDLFDDDLDGGIRTPSPAGVIDTPDTEGEIGCP